jgi:hypothetical protein
VDRADLTLKYCETVILSEFSFVVVSLGATNGPPGVVKLAGTHSD